MTHRLLELRPERPEDFASIRELVERAFESEPHTEGDEQDFIERQRKAGGYIPDLAFVARKSSMVVGHILLTLQTISTPTGAIPILLLACVAVPREQRGQGIARALIQLALRRAQAFGHGAIALVGESSLYGRFGFAPASAFGITSGNGYEPQHVLIRELIPGALHGVTGVVRFPT